MKIERFYVRDSTALGFLEKNLFNYKDASKEGRYNDLSARHLMKNEMIFRLDGDLKEGETLLIELFDRCQNDHTKELVNRYYYTVEKHDDVSLKVVLCNFKIELKIS